MLKLKKVLKTTKVVWGLGKVFFSEKQAIQSSLSKIEKYSAYISSLVDNTKIFI